MVRGLAIPATESPFWWISGIKAKIFHCFRWTCALVRDETEGEEY